MDDEEEMDEDHDDSMEVETVAKDFQGITLEEATKNLLPEEEILLRSCIDEISSVVGDSVSDSIIIQQVLNFKFNTEKALDSILKGAIKSIEIHKGKLYIQILL